MHLGSCLFAVVATSSAVVAQLSSDGCANLESVFTGFGFATTHGAVNAALTNCGCAFAVNVGAGQTAAAACAKEADSGEWSVASLCVIPPSIFKNLMCSTPVRSISNPPTTRGSFPPVLISPQANAVGFNFLTSLLVAISAILLIITFHPMQFIHKQRTDRECAHEGRIASHKNGFAVSFYKTVTSSQVVHQTKCSDISNNPSLNPLPGVVGGGGAPNYSFQNL
ncbi:hypothetical protein BC830DRAFT_724827 [Chytriomyces sp. MP71]|nr:hypothetical protein BC830DRAFT_724827 [Chytriomyces sp. MP71]